MIAHNVRPKLAVKARLQIDKVSGEPILLYPEGVLLLNSTGEAIIKLSNGQRTFSEIVAVLAEQYKTSSDALEGDVEEFLTTLYKHSLVELQE